ncbi:MAG: tRNA-dihydrouridine synthase, partial [Hyphomicrobiaceae bacterium]
MSGVSDLPFRRLAARMGAGLVVSEMVASRELAAERRDVVRKAAGRELDPFVIQLVGHDPDWMREGARIAEGLGAKIIDINMGCPSREVTGRLSGS